MGRGAVEEQQPRILQVGDARDSLKQAAVLTQVLCQPVRDERTAPKWAKYPAQLSLALKRGAASVLAVLRAAPPVPRPHCSKAGLAEVQRECSHA